MKRRTGTASCSTGNIEPLMAKYFSRKRFSVNGASTNGASESCHFLVRRRRFRGS